MLNRLVASVQELTCCILGNNTVIVPAAVGYSVLLLTELNFNLQPVNQQEAA